MCGIAGYVSHALGEDAARVRRWGDKLAHRGPDDRGIGVLGPSGFRVGQDLESITPESSTVLWNWRLAIIDLSKAGWQPMRSADGRHWIVYNGEVYNYRELRAELESLGCTFHSQTDTEVALQAFRCWGVDSFPRLVGMYAFAILDLESRRLVLARDPFGIKPLHYAAWPGGFAFASEQKALLDLPQVSRRVDAQSVYDYLRFGLTDHGPSTMLEGIRSCPPAHWMEVGLETATPSRPTRYWAPEPERRFSGSMTQAADQLRELFLDSVRLHLRSDVPVGAALSGGIDSSAIVCAMRHLEPDLELHAFGYVTDDPVVGEERWLDLAVTAARATVHKTRAGASDLVADLDRLLWAQDEPFGSTSIYAQYRVFRLAAEHGIKVMLDGQGADELLGGYHGLVAARLASLVRQRRIDEALRFAWRASRTPGRRGLALWAGEFLVPGGLQAPLRALVGQELVPRWMNRDWFAAHEVRAAPSKYASRSSPEVLREQMLRLLTRTNLPMLLRYEDRNSMAHSIESRVPFLTTTLADFMLSLPEEYLIDAGGRTKAVFRRAMRGLVPDAILERRDKIGFATPEHEWMIELGPQVERWLSGEAAARIPALHFEALRSEWRAFQARRTRRDFRVWRWINLIEWAARTGAEFS